MLIVLEGCDGVGKSTLANNLATVMNAEVIHCSQYTPNNYEFFHNIIEASKTKNIIADRFCYGQFVYQEEFERPLAIMANATHNVTIGKDEFEFPNGTPALHVLHRLETEMLQAGATVVHVTAPIEEIKERLEARKEYLINGLTVEQVVDKFRGTFKMSILPVVEWSTGRYIYE